MSVPPELTTPDVPTSVYLYYDQHDLLLYVGVTGRRTMRNMEHASDKEWWQFVTRQKVEHFPDRPAALAREKQLILEYRPPFNRQHNADWQSLRESYLAFAASTEPGDVSPLQLYRWLNRTLPLTALPGHRHALVTLAEHSPIATRVVPPGEADRIGLHTHRKCGYVQSSEVRGPFLVLHMSKVVPPLEEARLHLRIDMKTMTFRMRSAVGREIREAA